VIFPNNDQVTTVVIAREGGRSSIPETVVIEPMARGVLDAPPSRGMTVVVLQGLHRFRKLSQAHCSVGQISEIASSPQCKNIPLSIS
jgi:hypothetical protein